jgi:hypothetical protein
MPVPPVDLRTTSGARRWRVARVESALDDTFYWEARREMVASLGQAIDLSKVIAVYGQGREALPSSLMLTMAWSNANLTAEEFESALSGFEEVLTTYQRIATR